MSSAHKLKGSEFAVSEDFAPEIRLARRKLLDFGRSQEGPFKLRYDKLCIGERTFVYDQVSQEVKQKKLGPSKLFCYEYYRMKSGVYTSSCKNKKI